MSWLPARMYTMSVMSKPPSLSAAVVVAFAFAIMAVVTEELMLRLSVMPTPTRTPRLLLPVLLYSVPQLLLSCYCVV